MHTGRMSRMRTSCASLLWTRPAMRRACSREVRAGSGPFFAASLAAVQTELRDPRGPRRRHRVVDGLAVGAALSDVGGPNRRGLDLKKGEGVGPLEPFEPPLEP